MNNNLLLLAQKWLTELGIRTEVAQTYLKINRSDVQNCGLFDITYMSGLSSFLKELKDGVGSNKLYFEDEDETNIHLNSF